MAEPRQLRSSKQHNKRNQKHAAGKQVELSRQPLPFPQNYGRIYTRIRSCVRPFFSAAAQRASYATRTLEGTVTTSLTLNPAGCSPRERAHGYRASEATPRPLGFPPAASRPRRNTGAKEKRAEAGRQLSVRPSCYVYEDLVGGGGREDLFSRRVGRLCAAANATSLEEKQRRSCSACKEGRLLRSSW